MSLHLVFEVSVAGKGSWFQNRKMIIKHLHEAAYVKDFPHIQSL